EVAASGGVTRRARVREEGSLRVRCPGPPAPELEAVIVNTAGGVAGGDRFALDVRVAPGARLVVTTAAAEKIYRTLEPAATIEVKLAVGVGGARPGLAPGADPFGPPRPPSPVAVALPPAALP